MRMFATEIRAIAPADGELRTYAGPNVHAPSAALAQQWCELNGLGYCRVAGELIADIPCKPGTHAPDWGKLIDYDNELN